MLLIVPQSGTEQVLQTRVDDLGVPVVRGAEVVGLTQDDDGVTVQCADGTSIRTTYVVGCDGAHSTVRQLVGIEFAGKQYETHILLADVRADAGAGGDVDRRARTSDGVVLMIPFGDGWFRAIAWDRLREQAPLKEPVTIDEIRDSFHRIAGEDYGMTRHALEFAVPVASASRPSATGPAGCSSPATPRTCTRRSAGRA